MGSRWPKHHCHPGARSGVSRGAGRCGGPWLVGIVPVPGQALFMIAKHLQNTALTDPPARAFVDHAVQFAFQFGQQFDTATDQSPMPARDLVDLRTRPFPLRGQFEKLPNLIHRKTELARMADEMQAALVTLRVSALPARRSRAWRKQPLRLVVTQCLDMDVRGPRERADCQVCGRGHNG